jgi:hypothetical protein
MLQQNRRNKMKQLLLALLTISTIGLISLSAYAQSAAVLTPRGPYMIATGSQNMVWRIDQSTGLMSYCIRDTISTDPALVRQRPPICSAWGQ